MKTSAAPKKPRNRAAQDATLINIRNLKTDHRVLKNRVAQVERDVKYIVGILSRVR